MDSAFPPRTPGRDPLGLQTITLDRIMPRLLPGILVPSQRARYFSLHALLLKRVPAPTPAAEQQPPQGDRRFGRSEARNAAVRVGHTVKFRWANSHADPDDLRALTTVTDTSVQRAESAFGLP
jgi:hypothetical protein